MDLQGTLNPDLMDLHSRSPMMQYAESWHMYLLAGISAALAIADLIKYLSTASPPYAFEATKVPVAPALHKHMCIIA